MSEPAYVAGSDGTASIRGDSKPTSPAVAQTSGGVSGSYPTPRVPTAANDVVLWSVFIRTAVGVSQWAPRVDGDFSSEGIARAWANNGTYLPPGTYFATASWPGRFGRPPSPSAVTGEHRWWVAGKPGHFVEERCLRAVRAPDVVPREKFVEAESRASRLGDECGRLASLVKDLEAENGRLRRGLESLERKAGGKR